MKIKINHTTTYSYESVVPKLIQCLKLYPTSCNNQSILEWEIKSSSGKIVDSHTDALGHKIVNIFNNNLNGKLKITSRGVVKTRDFSGVVKGLKEKVNPLCFLRETSLTKPCANVEKICKMAKKKKSDLISFIHRLNLIVSDSIKYSEGSTNTSTSSKQALRQGRGVCQDFAHILISAARFMNLPARYINGFLLEDLNSGENSTHAWTEIYIEELGWVAFDPSHKKCIDQTYVRVSAGLDFLDASMIKGIKTNYNGSELLESKVFINHCQ